MQKKKIISLVCLLLLIVLGGEVLLSAFAVPAKAAEVSYSNVLDDLQKDENFNSEDYPADPTDYSLKVIQIAEGENGELFVYVYQPSNANIDLKAAKINMSLQNPSDRDVTYSLYSLTWLNSNGVFDKYIVNDFTVSSDEYRYYNIASIYRKYDRFLGDNNSFAIDNIQYIGFEVAQFWCAYYFNSELIYESEILDIVDINIQASGSVRYTEGYKLYTDKCDSHYIAFSISNFNVDKIYDADVSYTVTRYISSLDLTTGESHLSIDGEPETFNHKLTELDVGGNDGDGLFATKYTWNRIVDLNTFLLEVEEASDSGFSSEELSALKKTSYVFRFCETDYEVLTSSYTQTTSYSTVSDIGVLRLHFLSEGKVFNLGCVSDLVGIDNIPDAEQDKIIDFESWFEQLFSVLALILLVLILSTISRPVLHFVQFLWNGFKAILYCLFAVVLFPFKLFFSTYKKK